MVIMIKILKNGKKYKKINFQKIDVINIKIYLNEIDLDNLLKKLNDKSSYLLIVKLLL